MTENGKIEVIREEISSVFLHLVKIEAEGFEDLYFVDNNEKIISNGNEYLPCAFKITLPEQNDDGSAKPCQIEIDNVDRRIAEAVAETINKPVVLTISIVMAHNPDIIETGPFVFSLRNVNINKERVSADLYDFYIYDRNLPGLRYTPQNFPGLFA